MAALQHNGFPINGALATTRLFARYSDLVTLRLIAETLAIMLHRLAIATCPNSSLKSRLRRNYQVTQELGHTSAEVEAAQSKVVDQKQLVEDLLCSVVQNPKLEDKFRSRRLVIGSPPATPRCYVVCRIPSLFPTSSIWS